MPDQPTIDPEAIANLRDLNPGDGGEFLREIIAIYLEDTPKRLAELKASFTAGNVALFARSAHTIKGSSSNVGAQNLRAMAERLEVTARKEGLASVGSQVASCEEEYERVRAELTKLSA